MTSDITTATRRLIDEVYNKGDVDVFGEILGPGYLGNDPALPEPIQGASGERELVIAYRNAFPDLEVTVDDTEASSNWDTLGFLQQLGVIATASRT